MNNYDQSSSSENIQFSALYSYDLARIYFDDFQRENTRIDFGRDNSAFLLGNGEAPYYKKSELLKLKKAEIVELCQDFGYLSFYDSGQEYNRAELIHNLLRVSCLDFYQWLFKNHYWHDLREKIQHDFYISRGYSQGDAVYIVSLDRPLDHGLREYINHTLWDSPISIFCTVNDQEFFEDTFLDDQYLWDREVTAEKVKGLPISDYAKNWIIEALPEYLDYQ